MFREDRVFLPPEKRSKQAHIRSLAEYEELYRESLDHPEAFWARQAEETVEWFRKWDEVLWYDFAGVAKREGPYVRFFAGGKLNASYNCLDRHLLQGAGRNRPSSGRAKRTKIGARSPTGNFTRR